ncbi:MAG: hypothetical protein HYY84_08575 [Deltaproteobacteria bacterium]|nr:hypothetical protein [Deltaproteobacteria bacterium]
MLSLDDERWSHLEGGYRVPYDPRPALARLRDGDGAAWDELWNELHHQGDVGVASYAAVPLLVEIHLERDVPEWQTYALIGTIDVCRMREGNPKLPDWLQHEYAGAWESIVAVGCRDLQRTKEETAVRSILGVIALAKDIRTLGEIILDFTGDELLEMIQAFRDK